MKIGGYVRAEYTYGAGASQTNGPFQGGNFNGISGAAGSNTGPNGYNDRWDGGVWVMRSRAYISMDTREQTEWGVLRTYLNIGLNYDSPAAGSAAIFSGNRAFLQFAGFTVGLAQSFYDFYCVPCSQYLGITPASDTGDGGWKVIAYSLIWGAGITSTLSLEEPRRIGIVNTNAAANPFTFFGSAVGQNGITGSAGADSAKERFPDIVANLRIDQALYTAQVMFAAHDASAAYYFSTLNAINGVGVGGGVACPPGTLGTAAPGGGTIIGSEVCGHPADKLGWAAGAGFRINLPNTNGSYFQIQYNYTVGAARYTDQTQTGHFSMVQGGTLGYGILTDGIVNNATGTVDLTKVQGLNVAFDYHWNGKFWTSIYGSYLKVSYDGIANASICAVQNTFNNINFAATAGGVTGIANCQNDWSFWVVGSRWQYNFTPALYVGIEAVYQKLQTADAGFATLPTVGLASVAVPATVYQVTNQSVWSFRARFHRDILP